MSDVLIKLFGMPRSGGNYLIWLLEHNYDVRILDGAGDGTGERDGFYNTSAEIGQHARILVLSKHPLVWLQSMYRYHFRSGTKMTKDSQTPEFAVWVKQWNPLARWAAMHYHWLGVDNDGCGKLFVQYLRLLKNPERVCDGVAFRLGFDKRSAPFIVPEHQMNTKHGETKRKFWAGRYSDHPYMKAYYGGGFRAAVERMLDPVLLRKLDYRNVPERGSA